MSYVEFYDVNDQPMGKARVSGGKLVVDDTIPGIANTNVIEEGTGKLLNPQNGEKFLQNLAAMYEGPYVSARYFGEDAPTTEEPIEESSFVAAFTERVKKDDEWIPWKHSGGAGGGRAMPKTASQQRAAAKKAKSKDTGSAAKLTNAELIAKYQKRKIDMERPGALPDAEPKFRRVEAEMAKRGLLKSGSPLTPVKDGVARTKTKREQMLSQTVKAGARPPGAPRSVQVKDPEQPGAMPGLRPSYDRYARPMIGKLEPPKQPPNAQAKMETGAQHLLGKEILGIDTKRKKNSTSPGYWAKLNDGTEVYVRPTKTISTKVLRPFQMPWGHDNERELASQALLEHMPKDFVSIAPVAVRDVPGLGPSLLREKITKGVRGLDEGAPSFSGTVPLADRKNIALYDVVRGENDRHGGNYFLDLQKDGTSKVVLYDHGLAFPQQRSPQNGNWNPLNALTPEERRLDPNHVQTLKDLKVRQERVDADLLPLVGADAVRLMWERVDKLLETGEFPEVESIRRDEWP